MPECPEADDPLLVALAQNGDQGALEALLRRCYRPLRAWTFRLASRRAFRHLKRESRWKRLETDPDVIAALPASEPLPDTLEPGLLKLIEDVSPASRAVLLLHYQQDLSIEETAVVLDIPVGTAKSRPRLLSEHDVAIRCALPSRRLPHLVRRSGLPFALRVPSYASRPRSSSSSVRCSLQ